MWLFNFVRIEIKKIESHIKYDVYKYLFFAGGSLMIAALYAIYQKSRNLSVDWYIACGLFAAGVVISWVSLLAIRKISKSPTTNGPKIAPPQVLLRWEKLDTLGASDQKVVLVENRSDNADAYNVQIEPVSIVESVSASFPVLSLLEKNSKVASTPYLRGGDVGINPRLSDFAKTWIVPDVPKEFIIKDENGREFISFPVVVTFDDYLGSKYRVHFKFNIDLPFSLAGEFKRGEMEIL